MHKADSKTLVKDTDYCVFICWFIGNDLGYYGASPNLVLLGPKGLSETSSFPTLHLFRTLSPNLYFALISVIWIL